MFMPVFDKQIGLSFAPNLERMAERLMVQSALTGAVVVGDKVLCERAFELCSCRQIVFTQSAQ